MKMKSMFLVMVLAAIVAVQPLTAQNGVDRKPFCSSSKFKRINADVYIVIPDDILGQLVSGQFTRVAEQFNCSRVAMTPDEIVLFLQSDGFNLLKDEGSVFFVIQQKNGYVLRELIKMGDTYRFSEPLSYDNHVVDSSIQPFLQLVIPRSKKKNG